MGETTKEPSMNTTTTNLQVETFTSSPETFSVTSTLVTGERDALLVDAQFALPQAQLLTERIKASGKRLTTIYVTHWHPDHYFGLPAVLAAFPDARVVTLAENVERIRGSVADKVAQWKPVVGDLIPDEPVIPESIEGALELEGEELPIVLVGQGDAPGNSAVHVRSADTLITGDFVYNGTHVWLSETSAAQWQEWLGNLDRLEAVGASRVVSGHRVADAIDDARAFAGTREYIRDYAAALEASSSREELIERVKAKHGSRGLEIILEINASAAFPE
jgi:glyoxylase-like metal-dependent hydrolase (beta-lactamase superfamily II)